MMGRWEGAVKIDVKRWGGWEVGRRDDRSALTLEWPASGGSNNVRNVRVVRSLGFAELVGEVGK
jgi:hypothetical protein